MRTVLPICFLVFALAATNTFTGLCAESTITDGIAEHFDGVPVGGAPDTWCEYLRGGMMTFPLRIVTATNGAVRAHAKRESEFRYETTLTHEEQAYLATLLRVGRIMEKPGAPGPPSTDGMSLFWLRDGGRQVSIDLIASENDRDLIPVYVFLYKLEAQVDGVRNIQAGSVYEAMKPGFSWLQPAKAVEPLNEYLKQPGTWRQARFAWQALSERLSPEQWAGCVSLRLREASPKHRSILLGSLRMNEPTIEIRKPCLNLLRPVLSEWESVIPMTE